MTFLSDAELVQLTGRRRKSLQVAALRQMGVPFVVNAAGRAIVARSAFEPGQVAAPKPWQPAVLRKDAPRHGTSAKRQPEPA